MLGTQLQGAETSLGAARCNVIGRPKNIRLDAGGHHISPRPARFGCGQFLSKPQMPKSRQFDQRSPHGMHQVVFDE